MLLPHLPSAFASLYPYISEVFPGRNGLLAVSEDCLLQEECPDSSSSRVEVEMHRAVSFSHADIIDAITTDST